MEFDEVLFISDDRIQAPGVLKKQLELLRSMSDEDFEELLKESERRDELKKRSA